MKPRDYSTAKIGDEINVFDTFDYKQPKLDHVLSGRLVKLSPKFVTVKSSYGDCHRFHRTNGQIIGYSWPKFAYSIRPQGK